MSAVLNEKAKTLSGITTPDPQTIVFDFDYPDSAFIYLISFPSAGVVPMALFEDVGFNHFNWNPVGTGPFKADVVNEQTQITLKRNAKYWNPGVPSYAGVNWQMGIDDTLSMIRIESGQTDMMYDPVPSGYVQNVVGNPTYVRNHQTVKTPQDNCYWLSLSLKDPVLKDVRVRQAIAMAIDKQRVLQVMNGLGQVANGGFFSPLSPYYQDGLAYSYNVSKAKSLIAEAGVPRTATVKIWSSNRFPYEAVGQVVQANLATIGITAEYIPHGVRRLRQLHGQQPRRHVAVGVGALLPERLVHRRLRVHDERRKGGLLQLLLVTCRTLSTSSPLRPTTPRTRPTSSRSTSRSTRSWSRRKCSGFPSCTRCASTSSSSRVRDFQAAVGGGEDQQRYFYKYALT